MIGRLCRSLHYADDITANESRSYEVSAMRTRSQTDSQAVSAMSSVGDKSLAGGDFEKGREAATREFEHLCKTNASQIQHQEEEIQTLRSHIDRLSTSLGKKEIENQNLTALIVEAEENTKQLHVNLKNTREQLKTCRDDLFQLQPVNQIPDTDISSSLETLCEQVTNWIETEIVSFERRYPTASPGLLFSPGRKIEAVQLLKDYPDLGEYLIKCTIHRQLQAGLFNKEVYYPGLHRNSKHVLQLVETSMSDIAPIQDRGTINAWRSQTLHAIAKSDEVYKQRRHYLADLSTSIYHRISEYFPIIKESNEILKRFHLQVVLPAADLADKIHTSTTTYKIYVAEHPFGMWGPLDMCHLSECIPIDIRTGKTLRATSTALAGWTGEIGRLLMPFEPALWKFDANGNGTILRRPAFAVALEATLKENSRTSK